MKRTYQSRRRKIKQNISSSTYESDRKSFADAFTHHAANELQEQAPSSKNNANISKNINNNGNNKRKPIAHTYKRNNYQKKSPLKRLSKRKNSPKKEKQHSYNLRTRKNRISTKELNNTNNNNNNGSDNETDANNSILIPFNIDKYYKNKDEKKYDDCRNDIIISESIDTTTSFLSALSLNKNQLNTTNKQKSNKKQKHVTFNVQNDDKITTNDDGILTLDDICNDAIDISEPVYDPDTIPQHVEYNDDDDDDNNEWPSWVPKSMIPQKINNNNNNSPSRKRKRDENNLNVVYKSPPSKKLKSPNSIIKTKPNINNKSNKVFSTVRRNKKRLRRRSSIDYISDNDKIDNIVTPGDNIKIVNKRNNINIYDIETPIGSIRTQRIHRLTRKSNTDLLIDILLKDSNNELNNIKLQIKNQYKLRERKKKNSNNNKLTLNDLNGLKSVGRIDNLTEKVCLHLLDIGADSLCLNSDGLSSIYIAMHYVNNYNIISLMITKSLITSSDYDQMNQTYIFPNDIKLSLLDVALRICDNKTIKLLLQNELMPTKYSILYQPKIELMTYCKKHKMGKLCNTLFKKQLFDAVNNFDIDYIESIIYHGCDINIKINNKTCLYYLVEQQFDLHDYNDASDQYDTILYLLKHGASPNILDMYRTPMMIYPLQRSGQWNIKLCDMLLHYGANLKLKSNDGTKQNIYQYAKENCVDDDILNIITNYYKNANNNTNIGKTNNNNKKIKMKNKNKKKNTNFNVNINNNIKTVELNVLNDPTLSAVIKTKRNIVTKNYKRNKRTTKD